MSFFATDPIGSISSGYLGTSRLASHPLSTIQHHENGQSWSHETTLLRFGIPRNTLRDYIGICELRIIDSKRYKRVVEAERQRLGKVSVKSTELRRRAVLNEYRVQSNRLKEEKKLLPFYPKEGFYNQSKFE